MQYLYQLEQELECGVSWNDKPWLRMNMNEKDMNAVI
jgi:hypothetical protein